MGVNYPARENDGVVVVITPANQREQALCGLRVDDVIGVLDVAEASIQPMPEGLRASAPFLDSVVRVQADGSEAGAVLLQMLRPLVLAALAKPVQQWLPQAGNGNGNDSDTSPAAQAASALT